MGTARNEEFKENWSSLVQEYETMIQALYVQINHYKTEHESLKNDMMGLIRENETLSEQIKHNKKELKSNYDIQHSHGDIDLSANLRKQLEILLKEKESAINLWQDSLKTIDHLESELKLYSGQVHGYISKEEYSKAKQSYTKMISTLEKKISDLEKEINIHRETYEKCSQQKMIELEALIEKEKIHYNTIKELEAEKVQMKIQIDNLTQSKTEADVNLMVQEKIVSDLKRELKESKMKVEEACQIVDAAFMEKDAALTRERNTKLEIDELSRKLTESVNETKENVKKDLETMKTQYMKKLKIVYQEKVELNEQIKIKDIEMERLKRECKLLEDENERIKKGNICIDDSNTSKMLLLDKNMESTFQKLLLSEKKSLQLESERDSIKMDLEQMAGSYERDIKSRDIEKKILENKVESLHKDLNISNAQLEQVANHVKVLNAQIQNIDVEVRKKLYMKDLEIKNKVGEITENHAKVESDLHKNLDAQAVLNRRWQAEVKDITTKLETRLRQLKKETTELKKQNKKLQVDLLKSQSKVMHYESIYKKL